MKAWYDAYKRDGFVVVGVHAPEFASSTSLATSASGERPRHRAPRCRSTTTSTWNAYANQYWPANYLVDRDGHVRYVHFGEGEYDRTEGAIRTLLAIDATASCVRPDHASGPQTPETYLGWERLSPAYAGSPIAEERMATYSFPPALAEDGFAYAGRWRIEGERSVAGKGASSHSGVRASRSPRAQRTRDGGVLVDGRRTRPVRVSENRLYTLADFGKQADRVVELRLSPGLAAYAFTFGSEPGRRDDTGVGPAGCGRPALTRREQLA